MWLKVTFLLFFWLKMSHQFSTGGGTTACSTLMPSHGQAPQNSIPPVAITLESETIIPGEPKTIMPGQTLTLTVASTQPQIFLRGIMIQARTVENEPIVMGQFIENDLIRHVTCAALPPNSVATHRSNADKEFFNITWVAPSSLHGLPRPIQFQ